MPTLKGCFKPGPRAERACLSVRAYERDTAQAAAFALDELLWGIQGGEDQRGYMLAEFALRERLASGAL